VRKKSAEPSIDAAKNHTEEEVLRRNLQSWIREARLAIESEEADSEDVQHAYNQQMTEAERRYTAGERGTSKMEKRFDKIASNRVVLRKLVNKSTAARLAEVEQAKKEIIRDAERLRSEQKRTNRENRELKERLERAEQVALEAQQKIQLLQRQTGSEVPMDVDEDDEPQHPRMVRDSWIDRDGDESLYNSRGKNRTDTEHKKPIKYEGPIYTSGHDFPEHLNRVKLAMKALAGMSPQQEAHFFLSSLDENSRKAATVLTPSNRTVPIERFIANIRRYQPKASEQQNKFYG
jgi:hypothetical protein